MCIRDSYNSTTAETTATTTSTIITATTTKFTSSEMTQYEEYLSYQQLLDAESFVFLKIQFVLTFDFLYPNPIIMQPKIIIATEIFSFVISGPTKKS